MGAEQEEGMVAERLIGVSIYPETLMPTVILLMVCLPLVIVRTLNAEVVVGGASQRTPTATRLQDSLRQGDTRRNIIEIHFTDGRFMESLDILDGFRGAIRDLGGKRNTAATKEKRDYETDTHEYKSFKENKVETFIERLHIYHYTT